MALLDGTIDKLLKKEAHNIDRYLKGAKKLDIEVKTQEHKWIYDIVDGKEEK